MPRYIDADLTDSEILNAVQEETYDGDTFITVRRILHKLPTADVAPVVHARCVFVETANDVWKCSNCQAEFYNESVLDDFKFCPFCGAKKDEADEDDIQKCER